MSVTAGAKAGWSALKNNWIFFLLAASVLVSAAMVYDAKNPEVKLLKKINDSLGKLPIVGDWFTTSPHT